MTPAAFVAASAALLLGGSAPPSPPAAIVSLPAYEQPARAWTSVPDRPPSAECDRRIDQVRASAGQPRLERAPADAAKPILHYAVDRTIDGCDVLVPVGSPVEVLPVPDPVAPAIIPATPRR